METVKPRKKRTRCSYSKCKNTQYKLRKHCKPHLDRNRAYYALKKQRNKSAESSMPERISVPSHVQTS